MDAVDLQGGCTCKDVRYRLTRMPMFVHCCHCTWCQRQSGASFALNALIEADAVELISGQPERVTVSSQSGKGQTCFRCPSCRVAIWSTYAAASERIRFVRVGSLDHPEICPPDIHIYTASKQPWVTIGDGTPAVPAYYDPAVYWPAQSQARYKALAE